MSWSISTGGPRDAAIEAVRAQTAALTSLPVGEKARAEKIAGTVVAFIETLNASDTASVSAWGSESTVSPGTVTQIQGGYNVQVTLGTPQ